MSLDGLDLQAVVPALDGGVVVTVTFLDPAGDEVMGLRGAPIVLRAVLATAARVEDDVPRTLPHRQPQGRVQGIAGKVRRHPFGHRPAHDFASIEAAGSANYSAGRNVTDEAAIARRAIQIGCIYGLKGGRRPTTQ